MIDFISDALYHLAEALFIVGVLALLVVTVVVVVLYLESR